MKKAAQVTYHFSTAEVESILTREVEAKTGQKVDVRFRIEVRGGDPMDRFPGVNTVVGVDVTVSDPVKENA